MFMFNAVEGFIDDVVYLISGDDHNISQVESEFCRDLLRETFLKRISNCDMFLLEIMVFGLVTSLHSAV